MTDKSTLEKSFDEIGVKPVGRRTVYGRDVLLGDGFVTGDGGDNDPYMKLKKFGVEKGEFPNGCYVTVWLWGTDDQKVGLGLPAFFDPLHDIEQPFLTRRTMRLNTALQSAIYTIRSLKGAKKHAQ